MAVGKNSIKRAAGAADGEKSANAKKSTVKKAVKPAAEVTEVKAAVMAAPAPGTVKAAVKDTAKGKLRVDQADGVNAHYGVNTPLPTFLL